MTDELDTTDYVRKLVYARGYVGVTDFRENMTQYLEALPESYGPIYLMKHGKTLGVIVTQNQHDKLSDAFVKNSIREQQEARDSLA